MFMAPRLGFDLRPAGPEPSPPRKTKPNKATSPKSFDGSGIGPDWRKRSQGAYLAYFQWLARRNGPETGAKGRNDVSSMNCDTFGHCNSYISRGGGSNGRSRGTRRGSGALEIESRIPGPETRIPNREAQEFNRPPAIGHEGCWRHLDSRLRGNDGWESGNDGGGIPACAGMTAGGAGMTPAPP